MDIEHLLALQDLRTSLPPVFEHIMLFVSAIGNGPALIALVLIVYWCIDKRSGQIVMLGFCIANFIGQFIKMIACVYRPWIRDARIVASPAALEGATGYSFPSGHTVGTGACLGGFAWQLRKTHKVLVILCIAFIALMMFSRNLLGVHTLQDVLAGLLVAVAGIALANIIAAWLTNCDSKNPGHRYDIALVVAAVCLSVAATIFVAYKPYPMHYVDGALLVDPVIMQKDFFQSSGIVMGAALGWLLERRFVGFTTDALSLRQRILRVIVGAAVSGLAFAVADVAFKAFLAYNVAKLCSLFVLSFFAIFIAPACFCAIESRLEQPKARNDEVDKNHHGN